ncbi:hypothetical protein L7F22_006184 [Adiantum nelumboides]|nr:hypothetical protein [Adiantum nelumboides]
MGDALVVDSCLHDDSVSIARDMYIMKPKVIDALLSTHDGLSQSWIVDSGASFQDTLSLESFASYTTGSLGHVRYEGVGTIHCALENDQELVLHDVRYVLGILKSLLSVGQLDVNGYCTMFGGGSWKVLKAESHKELRHKRLGHMSEKGLDVLFSLEKFDVKGHGLDFCNDCIYGKQVKFSYSFGVTRKLHVLDLIHSDVCTMPVNSHGCARYTWVSFLKLKSEAFGSIRDWKAMVEKEKDLKVKSIRSDRGGEFLSENFARWCKSEGIRRQLTTPYTPSQNGVVERKNRTIMEMARAMLAHASLPRSYWAEACNTAVYIKNRSPTHALQDMTPFQAYYGRKPTVSHFRVFGCSAFVHIPKEKRQKLDFKSRKLLFLGYSAESDAYRLYDPDTRTTTVSRDVVFDESFITSAKGAAAQPIPILPPPSLPDPPASPVITPSTSHPVPPIQPPDVSPDHALSDSDSDLDVADATPEVDSAPTRREKRIPGWLYSTLRNLVWATSKHDIYVMHNSSVQHWSPLRRMLTEVLNAARPLIPAPEAQGRAWALQSVGRHVQISTMCVKNNLLVAGGFQGEMVCKFLNRPGVSYCAKITYDENAITNAVEIYENVSGATRLMTSNNDSFVRVFDVEKFEVLQKFNFPWPVNHTSVSPDNRFVVVVGDSAEGFVADCQSGKAFATLTGHLDFSFASAWHPNGHVFATGNQDMSCRLWDVRNLSSSMAVLKGHLGAIRSLRFTTDGRFLAMAEPADFVHIFDVYQDFKKSQEIDIFGEIAGISFSPDTEALFIGVADRTYGSLLEYNRCHVDTYRNMLL